MTRFALSAVAVGVCWLPVLALAQEPGLAADLRVFLDCQAPFCDFDHVRREIAFVNWMRDRQDADVHLLVTAERTGGGGWAFSLAFLGRRALGGVNDTLGYTSGNTDTNAEVRDGLTHTIRLGLVRYAARTALAPRLRVSFAAPGAVQAAQVTPAEDPWNFWSFRVGVNGSIEREAQQRELSFRGSASASRATEALKVEFTVSGRYRRDEFELDDTTTIVNTTERITAEFRTVWSLGPHWSAGFAVEGDRSTFSNRDLALSGGPTIEFNIFPYAQSTRQQLTLLYRVEAVGFDYQELTVEQKLSEILPRHSLSISAAVRQPWGQLHGSIRGLQYLHDPAVHRIDTFAGLEFRLFRGLNVNFFGSIARIKDQFFLPAAGLTEEEVLLERRQRETDFRFDVSLGFSFRFGSKFANVVNPRMGSQGGVFFF